MLKRLFGTTERPDFLSANMSQSLLGLEAPPENLQAIPTTAMGGKPSCPVDSELRSFILTQGR